MARYLFFLFRDGEVIGQTDCPCADDLEALEVARSLPAYQSVEIYSANRLVARVEQRDQPTNGRQRQSG